MNKEEKEKLLNGTYKQLNDLLKIEMEEFVKAGDWWALREISSDIIDIWESIDDIKFFMNMPGAKKR